MLRFVFAGLGAAIAAIPALAQQSKAPTAAQAAQQERMKSCNADVSRRNFNGAARQSFLSACLAGKIEPDGPDEGLQRLGQSGQAGQRRPQDLRQFLPQEVRLTG